MFGYLWIGSDKFEYDQIGSDRILVNRIGVEFEKNLHCDPLPPLKYRNGHNLAHKNRHLYFKAKAKTHWVQKQATIFKK